MTTPYYSLLFIKEDTLSKNFKYVLLKYTTFLHAHLLTAATTKS